jgi:ABC-type uncharacterized transport system YnjBCD ATPase subunit
MVFQSYALFPHLSAAENILFGLRVPIYGRIPHGRASCYHHRQPGTAIWGSLEEMCLWQQALSTGRGS